MAERKWSRKVHLQGHLHGWHEDQSERERHEHILATVRADGYATTIRRLNFLHNVADRQNNRKLARVAGEDERWLHDKREREN